VEGDGAEYGLLGELKDREPRLPEDMPPPTLANASSSIIPMRKNRNTKMVTPIFQFFRDIFAPPSSYLASVRISGLRDTSANFGSGL
jgi:hypothetical protein